MIRAIQVLGQTDDTPEVPVYTPPDAVTAQQQAQAANDEEAARARLRTVGGIALLGVVVVGAGALLFLTREPGSVRYRRALKRGQHRCIGHIRYKITSRGGFREVGKC
jgi:hypothetical protein